MELTQRMFVGLSMDKNENGSMTDEAVGITMKRLERLRND